MLRLISPTQFAAQVRPAVDATTLAQAASIVADVRTGGDAALRRHAERLGDLAPGAPLLLSRSQMSALAAPVPAAQRELLARVGDRIRRFAQAQYAALQPLTTSVSGGRAGHTISPVESAGCYAPGGRFPLPSSVLMTAVTARAAGVPRVVVASPRPAPITIAAAVAANADEMLCVGGAQAIAALAYGTESVAPVQTIAGPGNRWVTAAKQLVVGAVGIDMLAGPSELVVLADDSADAELIAADLLAQAEHDTDALPVLVTTCAPLITAVIDALRRQLSSLPTASTAQAALQQGAAVLCSNLDEAIMAVDAAAPEHLEVHTRDPGALARRLRHFGAAFIGAASAEVFGDYGIGPNHVLPTGRTARFTGGLSVLNFVRVRTWLQMDPHPPADVIADVAALARLEGLEAHARAAELRAPAAPLA